LGAQLTSTPDAANVIVTVLKAPKRIAKHFSDNDVNVFPFSSSDHGNEQETRGNRKEAEVDRMLGEGMGRDWRRFIVTLDWIKAVEKQGTLVDPDLFCAVALKAAIDAKDGEEPQPSTSEEVGLKRKKKSIRFTHLSYLPSSPTLYPTLLLSFLFFLPLSLLSLPINAKTRSPTGILHSNLSPTQLSTLAKHTIRLSTTLSPLFSQSTPHC